MKQHLIVLLPLLLACCSRSEQPSAHADQPTQPPVVEVALSQQQTVRRTLQISGTLLGNEEVVVSSEAEGQISRIERDFGDTVAAGQTLARVDPTELDMQVRQAQAAHREALARLGVSPGSEKIPSAADTAEVRQAKVQLDDANTRLRRLENLLERGVVSQQAVDDARTAQRVAAARHDAAVHQYENLLAVAQHARVTLDMTRKRASDAVVRSPISGIIQEKLVSRGEYVKVNQALFRVVSIHPIKLRAQLREVDVPRVKLGAKVTVTVDAAPGLNFPGTIRRVAPSVEEKSRTLTIEAIVPNSTLMLRPGFFARCSIPVGSESVVLIPQAALINVAGVRKAFVVEQGIVRERVVEVGEASGDRVEIRSGIGPGESVAITRLNTLHDGMAVKLNAEKREVKKTS